ncbi:hypothetical protein N7510_008814 [Penicillium lagena]|uniref:uncharacterized protein n=1 Tax=Penicillium lagena TaxID=94218 RepID=UPI00254039DA|nr:uncharacterized protein N7510_008814 [Penicillium lagena]KAJ5606033.1 hypothetical protein N7510_008814 [Penicillium lagena]
MAGLVAIDIVFRIPGNQSLVWCSDNNEPAALQVQQPFLVRTRDIVDDLVWVCGAAAKVGFSAS